jgi:16S rRNA (uracil1498-N3)-methyltransferase
MASVVRLHLDQPLVPGQPLTLDGDQANYLFAVMRMAPGDMLAVFNGRDGEWSARVVQATKRAGTLEALAQTRAPAPLPDLWLLFAPLKKARTDFLVEKAVELGAARLIPVQTDFTNADRIRQDRLQAHAVEAAEQCGGLSVPVVEDLRPLPRLLADWPAGRRLMWCDETALGAASVLAGLPRGPWAVLVGPEGGFSPAEQTRLRGLPFVHGVSLGPRILRAETAAIAALTLWQAALGDWA